MHRQKLLLSLVAFFTIYCPSFASSALTSEELALKRQHCAYVQQLESSLEVQNDYLLARAITPKPQQIFEYYFSDPLSFVKMQIKKNTLTFYFYSLANLRELSRGNLGKKYQDPQRCSAIFRADFAHIGLHRNRDETDLPHIHINFLDCPKIAYEQLVEISEDLLNDDFIIEQEREDLLRSFQEYLDQQADKC